MKKYITVILWLLIICIIVVLCNRESNEVLIDKYKTEIVEMEKAFAEMVKEKGMKAAFLAYASDEAVLNRDNTLIKGKKAIEEYFDKQTFRNARLEWAPEHVDVAASGDLAYTYGSYRFEAIDETGKVIKSDGIFHTVWKREPGGEWRYVWD